LDVFWTDTGGAISTAYWNATLNNAQWNPAFRVTPTGLGSPGGGVAAAAREPVHLDVFWADQQQGVSTTFWPAPSPWSLANYWRDMSYGQFSIDGSRIFGWDTMPQTKAAFQALGRQAQFQACLSASQALHPEVANYSRVVAIVNVAANSGATGNNAVFGPEGWTSTFAEHESGHMLGLDHSFDDTATSCDPNDDGRAGAYADGWDIMSALCFGGQNPVVAGRFGPAGPGLNAPYRDVFGWIPAGREVSVSAGSGYSATVTLAALSEATANGYLMLKLLPDLADPGRYYTLEFRRLDGWDVGIPRNTLLVHYVENGLTYLVKADNGPERVAGNTYLLHQVPQALPARHTGVATVAQKAGHLDVFWVGTDGAIWTDWWDASDPNGAWDRHAAFRITAPGMAPGGAGIATVSQTPGHLDVFWVGNDGAIWTDWWDAKDPNGAWSSHGPFPITSPRIAPPGAAIGAVSRFPGHLDVFWAGNDGAIWTNWWDAADPNGAWNKHTAFSITPRRGAPPGAGICAVAQNRDHLDLFWADNQGAIATNWWDAHDPNGAWAQHAAFRITLRKRLPPGAPVAAVTQTSGHLDVFWVGNDGAIWTNWWDAAAANGPWWDPTQNANPLHGPEKSFTITNPKLSPVTPGAGVTAVTQNQGHLDVFWVGNDGSVWTNWWDAGGPAGAWASHSPFPITTANTVPQGGSIAATVQQRGHLDIFWADAVGAIGTNWWDASAANGPWSNHSAFRVTTPNVVPPGAAMAPTESYTGEQFSIAVQTIDAATSTATVHVAFN
jgi:hypothetical protein